MYTNIHTPLTFTHKNTNKNKNKMQGIKVNTFTSDILVKDSVSFKGVEKGLHTSTAAQLPGSLLTLNRSVSSSLHKRNHSHFYDFFT